ncbi:MAG TPA: choice-of-anchor P family protein [Gemmatimonadales bacterium]|nr:choice-of-anchor P family protein [Gemmatimonadales bacterium]
MTRLTKTLLALGLINGALHAQTAVSGQALGVAVRTLATNLQSGQVTLPAGGGFVSADVDALGAPEISVDALTTMTSGMTDVQASTAQSTAHLENVNVLNGLITAETVIAATSSWVSGPAGRNALGSSFTNLRVNGVPLGSGDYLPAPNTRVDLPGVGYAVLNEQVASGASGIAVNMIHVVLRDALTGLTTGEIIVASASSSVGN